MGQGQLPEHVLLSTPINHSGQLMFLSLCLEISSRNPARSSALFSSMGMLIATLESINIMVVDFTSSQVSSKTNPLEDKMKKLRLRNL